MDPHVSEIRTFPTPPVNEIRHIKSQSTAELVQYLEIDKDKNIARVGTWAMLFLGKPEASHLMLNTKLEHQKEDEG